MSLELNTDLNDARERVSEQVLTANTLPEIEAAKQVLREWMKAHPEEQGMRAGFEQLYTLQEIIEDEEAGRARSDQRPAAAGRRPNTLGNDFRSNVYGQNSEAGGAVLPRPLCASCGYDKPDDAFL